MSKCQTCGDSNKRYRNLREKPEVKLKPNMTAQETHDYVFRSTGFSKGTLNRCPTCGRLYYATMDYNGFGQMRVPVIFAWMFGRGTLLGPRA